LDLNHEATIGFLTETQSALHYRDSIEANASATFNISAHIPISIQERRFPISPPTTDPLPTPPPKQQHTTGLLLITDIQYVEEVKTLCKIYRFDNELIQNRAFMPKNSRLMPYQPYQSLDPQTHMKMLRIHAHKMRQLSQVKLHQITYDTLDKNFQPMMTQVPSK